MRRLICLLAAVAAVASPLATAGVALADDHRGGGRHEQGGGGRQGLGRIFGGGGGREFARPQEYRPQEYRQPDSRREYRPQPEYRQPEYRQPEPRGQEYRPEAYRGDAADPRYGYRGGGQAYPAPAYGGQRDPRYDPRVYAPPPGAYSSAPRRGGYMGEGAPVVGDYAAKRLRAPPPGYDWMQTPRGYALVSRSTHQVFDVVPY
ncbi:MAG: RcnB family protein [Proteobacteria bacterium]|nr:RcnB family protein [Pseudomonadota bacterium]